MAKEIERPGVDTRHLRFSFNNVLVNFALKIGYFDARRRRNREVSVSCFHPDGEKGNNSPDFRR
jgi:hypothetical protein